MENFHLIVESNVTQKKFKKKFDWAFYDNNISKIIGGLSKFNLLCKNI